MSNKNSPPMSPLVYDDNKLQLIRKRWHKYDINAPKPPHGTLNIPGIRQQRWPYVRVSKQFKLKPKSYTWNVNWKPTTAGGTPFLSTHYSYRRCVFVRTNNIIFSACIWEIRARKTRQVLSRWTIYIFSYDHVCKM